VARSACSATAVEWLALWDRLHLGCPVRIALLALDCQYTNFESLFSVNGSPKCTNLYLCRCVCYVYAILIVVWQRLYPHKSLHVLLYIVTYIFLFSEQDETQQFIGSSIGLVLPLRTLLFWHSKPGWLVLWLCDWPLVFSHRRKESL
jgi:hypothetical protein